VAQSQYSPLRWYHNKKTALKPYPDWVCGKIEGKELGNKRDKM